MTETTQPTNAPVVHVTRTYAASAARVYRAWLEPELLQRWMAPGMEAERVEVDERVGGRFRVWHARDGVSLGGFEANIVELVPNERIVFDWGFVGPERSPRYDSRLTITLHEPEPGRTELTLLHERLDALRDAMPEAAAGVEYGWELVLGQLSEVLA